MALMWILTPPNPCIPTTICLKSDRLRSTYTGSLSAILPIKAHLNGSIVCNQFLLHGLIPEVSLSQIFQQMVVDHLKLAGEHTSRVDVTGVWLKRLVVAENLSCGGRGHGRQEEAVANAMPRVNRRNQWYMCKLFCHILLYVLY